jgi:hypothetical protein
MLGIYKFSCTHSASEIGQPVLDDADLPRKRDKEEGVEHNLLHNFMSDVEGRL